jgi:undecaprenyl-diphosphatase
LIWISNGNGLNYRIIQGAHLVLLKRLGHFLHGLDVFICLKVFGWSGRKLMDRVMIAASRLGDPWAYGIIGLLIVVLDSTVSKILLPVGAVSLAIEISAQTAVKYRAKRLRPFKALPEQIRMLVRPLDEWSFPSGHAAGAFVMATVLRHFYPHFGIPFYLGASTISFSRIYNGVHYPSDVLFGCVLGIVSARLGLSILM